MAHSIGVALTTAISEDDTVRIPCQPNVSSPAPVATISSHLVHSRKGILDYVEKEWMDSLKIPQVRFVILRAKQITNYLNRTSFSTYSPCFSGRRKGVSVYFVLLRITMNRMRRQITKIRDLIQEWVRWDALESLANYRCAMETLFGVLKTMPVRLAYFPIFRFISH
jgi:hypothetical protein